MLVAGNALLASALLQCPASPPAARALLDMLVGPGTGYDALRRPGHAATTVPIDSRETPSTPDIVYTQLQLFGVTEVNQIEGSIETNLWVRTIWFDPRLMSNTSCHHPDDDYGLSLPGVSREYGLWQPSTYFENERKRVVLSNSFYISPSGRVWWVTKLMLTTGCHFDLSDMPFDVQHCRLRFSVFDMETHQVEMDFLSRLYPDMEIFRRTCNDAGSALLGWQMYTNGGVVLGPGATSGSVSNQSLIDFKLVFERDSFVYQEYTLPLVFALTMFPWLAFLMHPPKAYTVPRVTLCVVAVLALLTEVRGITASIPNSNTHVWLLSVVTNSLYFAMTAMVEVAITGYLVWLSQSAAQRALTAIRDLHGVKTVTPMSTPSGQTVVTKVSAIDVQMADSPNEPMDETPVHQMPCRMSQPNEELSTSPSPSPELSTIHYFTAHPPGEAHQRSWAERCCAREDGSLRFNANKLDRLFRIGYPVAYAIYIGVMYATQSGSKLPATIGDECNLGGTDIDSLAGVV